MKHRVADLRVIRLTGKWLDAGVLDDGRLTSVQAGTPQGSVISPLLTNIYLHYVFDLWIERWRRQRARGTVIVSRYADDTVVGFQYETDGSADEAPALPERVLCFVYGGDWELLLELVEELSPAGWRFKSGDCSISRGWKTIAVYTVGDIMRFPTRGPTAMRWEMPTLRVTIELIPDSDKA
ncbi:hypothetical protein OKW45_001135 [Paraburkholderia sp. WSM4175]